MSAAIDRAVGSGYAKRVVRSFTRGRFGITYEVVIVPFRRRADGTLGKLAGRPVYFEGSRAEYVLARADDWLALNVPESQEVPR